MGWDGMGWDKSLAYHRFDGVTLRTGDGYTGAAVRGIVPSLEGEGRAEEVAWEGVAGERACSSADIAAVEGGFPGGSVGGAGGCGFGGRGGSRRLGGSADDFDGSFGGGGLHDGGLHGWGSNGFDDGGSLG
jgi:hypothetical protein